MNCLCQITAEFDTNEQKERFLKRCWSMIPSSNGLSFPQLLITTVAEGGANFVGR